VNHSPALIVFCREPIPGRTKTRLMSHIGAAGAAALADAFIVDTLAKVAALHPSKLVIAASAATEPRGSAYFRRLARRFHADLADQGQGSLGARMARVLSPYADETGALLFGTDLPSLPVAAVRRLLELSARRRIVLGPSLDGGYYAIGVRGTIPPVFTGIRWSTSSVLAETLRRVRQAGLTAALGPVWHDVDRWGDLMLLSSYLGSIESGEHKDGLHPCPRTASVLRRLGLLARRR